MPEQILCDNASPLVTSHDANTGVVVFHPGFAAFCRTGRHHSTPCRPRRARTGEDRTWRRLRPSTTPAGRAFVAFERLQNTLAKWIVAVADHRHMEQLTNNRLYV
jgi:transposase